MYCNVRHNPNDLIPRKVDETLHGAHHVFNRIRAISVIDNLAEIGLTCPIQFLLGLFRKRRIWKPLHHLFVDLQRFFAVRINRVKAVRQSHQRHRVIWHQRSGLAKIR